MDRSEWTYYVERPLEGTPDAWYTVARAITPEGAGELVRILLAQHDDTITVIRIRSIKVLR